MNERTRRRYQLIDERAKGLNRGDEIVAEAQATNREITAAEAEELGRLRTRRVQIDHELEAYEAEREELRRMPAIGAYSGNGIGPNDSYSSGLTGNAVFSGPRFAQMFPAHASDQGGWNSMNEYMQAVANRLADPRLMASDGANSTVPSEGGFMVPGGFYAGLLDASLEDEIVRPRARLVPMMSESMDVPLWDRTDRSGGSVFGFTAAWMSETEQGSKQKPRLRSTELKLKKLGIFVPASNRILRYGVGFDQQLQGAMRAAIGWTLDDAFLNGDGAGKPLGVFNSPTLVTVAKESGQAADTVVYANLSKMASRHKNYSRAVWVCSQTVLPELLELSIPVGAGGSHVPVLTGEGNNLEILKRPVVFTEKLAPVGDLGDILLADFSEYIIGFGREAEIARSEHALFDTDETYFRILSDVDGHPIDAAAETPRNGSTLSAFVTLAARA